MTAVWITKGPGIPEPFANPNDPSPLTKTCGLLRRALCRGCDRGSDQVGQDRWSHPISTW